MKLSKRKLRKLEKAAENYHANDPAYKKDANFSFFIYLVAVIVCALALRLFIFEPVRVDGDSMVPTLHNDERMFVEKVSLWVSCPERGEIITCFYPGYKVSCVKRVIATPGETVEIIGGEVYIDGARIDESRYWNGEIYADMAPVTVPEGHVFVMGDNRNDSKDSRNPSVGSIPYERIVGRCRAVIWPIGNQRDI